MGRPTRVRIRVPGSTANLGPGFDCLGMALGLYDEIDVEVQPTPGVFVDVAGEGSRFVPRDERHLVLRAMRQAFEVFGGAPVGLRLRCTNAVPHSRGLGSSAAAAVAGVTAAAVLSGHDHELERDAVLQIAAGMEGHADNAAASLLGGFVVAWEVQGSARRFHAEKLDVHPDVRPVALVAGTESSTKTTRGLLPEQVPLGDAAFTGSRCALAVLAMTRRPELLLAATEDRLHQPYRRPAYPSSLRLVEALRSHGVPAAISGAGPTVLALTSDGTVPADVDTDGFAVRALPVDTDGVRVEIV
ncbi:Homoserine kinase [Pseudonocardia sp. Ae168_Ps1]|uniref:homoserine kinase n=1 Tax=unclassified Pseudonocardia TaxID=2619320 RepID=UPI0001FFDA4F|nr:MULTISPECIES: homoserine kinase [unclassified Pseudonocardia]ALE72384.1 serine kinase [Pseudonocardia sp. EC080625-04]ALL75683.1 serine kinase [Pseudonocardia sp. EC080610-09]ALL82711.1 serine kinase [Pseudonocardia sp. EC080619-01]OLL73836.1 Homoserine kinase [Pseudonocardia sp. Ae150A_Ps1]OLL79817.1 Homoserine kinase [Pseudonocardia sp. Ae168_Ps1]